MSMKQVADLMTRDVAVINRTSDVHELEKLLLEKRVHGLPVVDDDGILVGVVSQTDLLAWHYNSGVDGGTFYDLSQLRVADDASMADLRLTDIQTAAVEEVMSPVVHCIRADLPIDDGRPTDSPPGGRGRNAPSEGRDLRAGHPPRDPGRGGTGSTRDGRTRRSELNA